MKQILFGFLLILSVSISTTATASQLSGTSTIVSDTTEPAPTIRAYQNALIVADSLTRAMAEIKKLKQVNGIQNTQLNIRQKQINELNSKDKIRQSMFADCTSQGELKDRQIKLGEKEIKKQKTLKWLFIVTASLAISYAAIK